MGGVASGVAPAGAGVGHSAMAFAHLLHPSQQPLQLLLLERRADKLAAGEDDNFAVVNGGTLCNNFILFW